MNHARSRRDLVRHEVRRILEKTPAFGWLPGPRRRQLAYGMVAVGEALADREWLLQAPASEVAAKNIQEIQEKIASSPSMVEAMGNPLGGYKASAEEQGSAILTNTIQNVDFPSFVSGLIQGVFQAIVQSSIQQMEAYEQLVMALVQSAKEFGAQNYSNQQAGDYLTSNYPQAFKKDSDGRVVAKDGGTLSKEDARALGVSQNTDPSDPDAMSQLNSAAKTIMGRQRQQMLATLVMMGINRIIVTDGRINAKVVFDLQATDSTTSKFKAGVNYDSTTRSHMEAKSSKLLSLLAGSMSGSTDVTTNLKVMSALDTTSDSKAELKARLSGEVDVNFKSETFPLERLVPSEKVQEIRARSNPNLPRSSEGAKTEASG